MNLVLLFISAALINNVLLSRFLGECPFLGMSKSKDSAIGMGLAVIFVITISGAITWFLNELLVILGLEFLQTISFILIIAVLVQFVELFLKKTIPSL
jgi:electron transport complex protein RnfA